MKKPSVGSPCVRRTSLFRNREKSLLVNKLTYKTDQRAFKSISIETLWDSWGQRTKRLFSNRQYFCTCNLKHHVTYIDLTCLGILGRALGPEKNLLYKVEKPSSNDYTSLHISVSSLCTKCSRRLKKPCLSIFWGMLGRTVWPKETHG